MHQLLTQLNELSARSQPQLILYRPTDGTIKMRLTLERILRDAVPCQRQPDHMAQKPWIQANIHAPGTGFALLVIAFCLLLQAIPSAICVLTPRAGWDPPLSPERVRYCKGG